MPVGSLVLNLEFSRCSSLKMKRGLVKPILFRLHREFFISIAEVDHLDAWSHAVIKCALVANDRIFIQQVLHKVVRFIEDQWPDVIIPYRTLCSPYRTLCSPYRTLCGQQEHIEILT